eukprot:scaffold45806_cov237-Amphora_coffeaeformis.AAC.6
MTALLTLSAYTIYKSLHLRYHIEDVLVVPKRGDPMFGAVNVFVVSVPLVTSAGMPQMHWMHYGDPCAPIESNLLRMAVVFLYSHHFWRLP